MCVVMTCTVEYARILSYLVARKPKTRAAETTNDLQATARGTAGWLPLRHSTAAESVKSAYGVGLRPQTLD